VALIMMSAALAPAVPLAAEPPAGSRLELKGPVLQGFAPLYAQYAEISSVHLRAAVTLSFRVPLFEGQPAPVQGTGVFEYWEQDGKFRARCQTDPRLGLQHDLEIAYDGEHYQLRFLDSKTVSVQDEVFDRHRLPPVPMATPNPLYLPVAFLAPGDDECPGCQLLLSKLHDASFWQAAAAKLEADALSTPTQLVWRFPGGARRGHGYEHRLRFDGMGEAATLSSIERLDNTGRVQMAVVLENLKTTVGLSRPFPHGMRIYTFDPDLEDDPVVAKTEYAIEVLEVGVRLPEEVFRIEGDDVTHVWDSDTRQFLRGRAPAAGNPEP
jgi:hypothetical protein